MPAQRTPTVLVRNMPPAKPDTNHFNILSLLQSACPMIDMINSTFPFDRDTNVNTHAYLHFANVSDASRVQSVLDGRKFNQCILQASTLLPEGTQVKKEQSAWKQTYKNKAEDFPSLPLHDWSCTDCDGACSCDTKSTTSTPSRTSCTETVRAKNTWCLECKCMRPHETRECPSLRLKVAKRSCAYCKKEGHILFANYSGKKVLMCPVACANPKFQM